jgi:hypothetical protein
MVTIGASSTLTINVPTGTASGAYTVTVTGTGSTGSHFATVVVTVGEPDFSFAAVGDTIVVFRNDPLTPAGAIFGIQSINNFAGTLTLTATITFPFVSTPGSATLPFTLPSSVDVPAGGTISVPFSATVARITAGTGLYLATLTATGVGKTHVATLKIWVIDYSITPQDTVIKMINQPGTFGQDPLSIAPLGTPLNATGFNINPGFTEGTAAFPTEYYTSSRAGLKFDSALGLDTSATSRRCILKVFDSAGNLIRPTISGGKVVSFAGPLVHLNGDQFGFGPTSNGCRLDSFWYVDPLNGNTLGTTFDTNLVTVEPITTTPDGTYTALVCLQAGGDVNCISITIILVAPPAPPALNQFTGRNTKVSLASGGQQVFKVGVFNQDNFTAIFVQVSVTATSSDGSITITSSTGVVAIPAIGNFNNIPITLDFRGVAAGTTFNENVVISYGVAPHYLTVQSTQTIGTTLKLTGSVIVTP